jgi:hypothetical protein
VTDGPRQFAIAVWVLWSRAFQLRGVTSNNAASVKIGDAFRNTQFHASVTAVGGVSRSKVMVVCVVLSIE